MKLTKEVFRFIVDNLISEAKKKKEKSDKSEKEVNPKEYCYSDDFDFSAPLGAYNLYRSQGMSNFGPYTGEGPKIDDRINLKKDDREIDESTRRIDQILAESSIWDKIGT